MMMPLLNVAKKLPPLLVFLFTLKATKEAVSQTILSLSTKAFKPGLLIYTNMAIGIGIFALKKICL